MLLVEEVVFGGEERGGEDMILLGASKTAIAAKGKHSNEFHDYSRGYVSLRSLGCCS